MALTNRKYLQVTPTKQVTDLCDKNIMTSKKEVEEDNQMMERPPILMDQ